MGVFLLRASTVRSNDLRRALTITKGGGAQCTSAVKRNTFMVDRLILKIVLKNSLSHKHSNVLIFKNTIFSRSGGRI